MAYSFAVDLEVIKLYLILRYNSYVLIYNLFNQGLLNNNWLHSQSMQSHNQDRGYRDLCKTQARAKRTIYLKTVSENRI